MENDEKLKNARDIDGGHTYFSSEVFRHTEKVKKSYYNDLKQAWDLLVSFDDPNEENEKKEDDHIDPALLFKCASNLNLNSSGTGQFEKPACFDNVAIVIRNFTDIVAEYEKEEWELEEEPAIRAIITRKWNSLTEMHNKLILMAGYNPEVYFELEKRIIQIFVKNSLESGSSYNSAKLPKLTIPKFSVNLLEWNSFKQLFNRMVGNKKHLSDSEKLAYLVGQLTDEPKRLISALPVVDQSYDTAWNILDKRFSDQQMVLKQLLDKIFRGNQMNGNSIQNMKEVYDSILESRMTIDNMKLKSENLIEYILYYAVDKRIDNKNLTLFENALTTVGEFRTYADIMEFMDTRIHHLSNKYQHGN